MNLPKSIGEARTRDIGIYDDGVVCSQCKIYTVKRVSDRACRHCYEKNITPEQRRERREAANRESRLRQSAPRSRIEAEEIDHPYYRASSDCSKCNGYTLRYTETGECMGCHQRDILTAQRKADRRAELEARKPTEQKKQEALILEVVRLTAEEVKREDARERKRKSREKERIRENARERKRKSRAKQRTERNQSTEIERGKQ